MDAFDIITELHLRDKEIQEIGSWVKECSSLPRLVLNKMQIEKQFPVACNNSQNDYLRLNPKMPRPNWKKAESQFGSLLESARRELSHGSDDDGCVTAEEKECEQSGVAAAVKKSEENRSGLAEKGEEL
ncbi:hypothetical protein YC2023_105862 [Brassica napus]